MASPSRHQQHATPPRHMAQHAQQQVQHAQQAQQHRGDEEWGHGELYEPPVACFDAASLGAAAAAQAEAPGPPEAGPAAAPAPEGGDAAAAVGSPFAHHTGRARFSHQGSGSSGTRRSVLSSLSVERHSRGSAGEAAAAAAAAEALAAVEAEAAERQRTWLGHAAEAAQAPIMLLLQVGAGGSWCRANAASTLCRMSSCEAQL